MDLRWGGSAETRFAQSGKPETDIMRACELASMVKRRNNLGFSCNTTATDRPRFHTGNTPDHRDARPYEEIKDIRATAEVDVV